MPKKMLAAMWQSRTMTDQDLKTLAARPLTRR
jgi:hypothetical protein